MLARRILPRRLTLPAADLDRSRSERTPIRHLPAALLLIIGFWQMPVAAVGAHLAYLPGDLGDNRLNNYVLEHGYRWLTREQKRFWDAPFCWPAWKVTARSDAHLGELPFYAAFRAAGADPERAFQHCVLLFFAANFGAALWALRRLGFGSLGAAAGAYVFAFGLPVPEHLGNLQIHPRFLIPPALALAWGVAWRPSWRGVLACALCVVGQLYLSMYMGLMLVGLLGLAGVLTVLVNRGSLPWRDLVRPGWGETLKRVAAVGVAVVASMPLLVPHLRMARESLLLPRETLVQFIPAPSDWLRPTQLATSWKWLGEWLPGWDDPWVGGKMMFAGLVPLLGVGLGLVLLVRGGRGMGRRGLVAVAALTFVTVAVIVVRSEAWSPYESLLSLPLVGTLRGISRVILVLLFPLAISTAWAVDAVGRLGPVAAVLALGVLMIDQRMPPPDDPRWAARHYSIADAQARRHELARQMRHELARAAERGVAPQAVYVFPRPGVGWDLHTQLDAMWAAQEVGLPTLNGWTGHLPQGWFPFESFTGVEVWVRRYGMRLDDPATGVVFLGTPHGFEHEELEQRLRRLSEGGN